MKRIVAILLALAPVGAVSETVTFAWTPDTEEQAMALRLGLALHSLRNGVRVRQSGRGHEAWVDQSGIGNQAVVVQRGRDHLARVAQAEGGNALVLLQVGRGGEAGVAQSGGEVGVALQISGPDRWKERLEALQP